jgi:hypothetical protein
MSGKRNAIYRGRFRIHNRGNYPDFVVRSLSKKRAKFFGTCAKLLNFEFGPVAQLDRAPVS